MTVSGGLGRVRRSTFHLLKNDAMVANPHTGLVTYQVLVGDGPSLSAGNEVPNTVAVSHIEVTHEIDRIPEATLTIVDGNVATADFEVSDSDLFVPGKYVEVRVGYDSDTQTVFKGVVVSIKHTIRSGSSRLKVLCKHDAVKMTVGKKSKHYEELSDSDLINNLIRSYGLARAFVTDTTSVHEQLLQAQVTDWDFMLSRADSNGLHCFATPEGIAVEPIDIHADATVNLRYGRDIYELDTEIDARRQHTSLETYSWNYTDQEVQQMTGDGPPADPHGRLTAGELAEVAGQPYELRTSVHLPAPEQQKLADAKKTRQAMAKIKGTVKFSGNAAVKPGAFISIEGAGAHFNGKAFVAAVTHHVEEGSWFTTAQLGGDERFFAERIRPDVPAAEHGSVSYMDGFQIGIVIDIVDPKGEGRVKLKFPIVDSGSEGIYARVATLDAGNGRGTFFRPEVGDEVVAGFVNGDAAYPVIVGMLHSSALPPPFEAADDNHEKGYVSRNGVKVTIHDGDKRITIETPGGRHVTLDDNAGEIIVADDGGNRIVMDSRGVVIKTSGDLMLEASGKIGLKAVQLVMEANSSVDLKGSGTVTIDGGATTKVKGGGMVDIQGGMVKIN